MFDDGTNTKCIHRDECEDKVGFYAEYDANLNTNSYSDTKQCLACDTNSNCFDCRNSATWCTKCNSNYMLVQPTGACTTTSGGCPEGTYLQGDTCVACFAGCQACNGETA